MNRIQLRKGLGLVLHNQEYIIEQRLPDGEIKLKNILTNTYSNLKEAVLTQLLFQGELKFLNDSFSKDKQQRNTKYDDKDFTQLPANLREEAKRKYSYVKQVLELTPNKQTATTLNPIISQVSKEIHDRKPPSWSTLYRWYKDYSSSGDIRTLIPLHSAKGNSQSRLDPEVKQIIEDAINSVYLNTTQAQGMDVYERVIISINQSNRLRAKLGQQDLAIPSNRTIYRAIAKLDPHETARISLR